MTMINQILDELPVDSTAAVASISLAQAFLCPVREVDLRHLLVSRDIKEVERVASKYEGLPECFYGWETPVGPEALEKCVGDAAASLGRATSSTAPQEEVLDAPRFPASVAARVTLEPEQR